ncbi:MAG: lysophospholipid acyltransferase family protein [Ramlibacter sp.]
MRSQDGPEFHPAVAETVALPAAAVLVNALKLYAGLVTFAAACLLTTAYIFAGSVLLTRRRRRMFARTAISRMFRSHFRCMEWIGVVRLDVEAMDVLRDGPAMIISPNHPSSIDAALVLSRIVNVACIMKADVLQNPLFGSGAREAGYITSDPVRSMLRSAEEDLRGGGHLLLFPEGTRTVQLPLNSVQRTAGLIAKRAQVPVQTVIIESNSAFLAKGWPLTRIPAFPMEYKIRLGRRFDPPDDVDAFAAQLDAYFRDELAHARLPLLPGPRPHPRQ